MFLRKSRICFLFVSTLHLHMEVVRFMISCQRTDKILLRSRFALMSGSEKFSVEEAKHVEPIRAELSELFVLDVNCW